MLARKETLARIPATLAEAVLWRAPMQQPKVHP